MTLGEEAAGCFYAAFFFFFFPARANEKMLLIRLVEVQRLLNSTSSREGNEIKYGVII